MATLKAKLICGIETEYQNASLNVFYNLDVLKLPKYSYFHEIAVSLEWCYT